MKKKMKDMMKSPPVFRERLLKALLLEEKALAKKRRIRYAATGTFAVAALLLIVLTVALPGGPGSTPEPVIVKISPLHMGLSEGSIVDLYRKADNISEQGESTREIDVQRAMDKTLLLKSGKSMDLKLEKEILTEQAYALAY